MTVICKADIAEPVRKSEPASYKPKPGAWCSSLRAGEEVKSKMMAKATLLSLLELPQVFPPGSAIRLSAFLILQWFDLQSKDSYSNFIRVVLNSFDCDQRALGMGW